MTKTNKNAIAVSVLALSMLVASACGDTIKAKPTFYDTPIVDTDNTITHNLMSVIYDALSGSASNSEKVLNAVIDYLAEEYFGNYQTAKELSAKTASDAKSFMDAHKFYSSDTSSTDEEKFQKLCSFVQDMEKRVREAYYEEAKGDTYSYRKLFNEENYVQQLRSQMYDIVNLPAGEQWYKDVLVTEDYKTDLTGCLHIGQYEDYTNRYFVKKFYRSRLIEQYMYDENYSLLGRSYARKINYVAISDNSDYAGSAKKLMAAFSDQYIEADLPVNSIDLSILTEAWNGISDENWNLSLEAQALLDAAGFEKKTISYDMRGVTLTKDVYPATKFGSLLEKYSKITDDRNTTKNDIDFTNNNSYPKEIGLQIKIRDILLNDYTVDGWFNKNGSSELPSDVQKRLFDIKVANAVDHMGVTQSEDGAVTAEAKTVEYQSGDYVMKKNGNYWLVASGSQKIDISKYKYIIYSNSTYYMVQVNEAVSTSKLSVSEDNINNYAHLRSGQSIHAENSSFTVSIANEVAKLYASKDVYKNDAYSKYIESSNIIYYDQVIYDYFKTTFPELFD